MLKSIPIVLILLSIAGCSSQKDTTKQSFQRKTEINLNSAMKNEALSHFIDGSTNEVKGDYASAILEFQDALRIDPDEAIYYALAKNYLFLNKLPLALQNCKSAINLDSNNTEYFNLLSDIYIVANQFDSAAIALNKIIKIDSSDVSSYYRLARIYENKKPLKAIETYNKVTSLIGPDWSVLMHVAELYAGLGDFNNAASSIQKLIEIDPNNNGLKRLLSEYFFKAKRYTDAMKVVNDIISALPDDIDAHERKAEIYIAMNKWQDAALQYNYILSQPKVSLIQKIRIGTAYFNRSLLDSTLLSTTKRIFQSIDKDSANWQVKMYLGAISINEKNDSAAIKYFNEATQLASWNVEAWVRLGGLYFDTHKYDEAEKVLRKAVISFPEDFRVNLILGLSLSQNGKYIEAEGYLKKAVDLDSTDINALSAYGYTLSQLKKNDEAIIYISKALTFSPDDINLLGTLGLIYDTQKKWNQCDSVYKKALLIDSLNALINNNYAYSLSERGINLDQALKMSNIAIKAEPVNSAYLDTMGWIYFKMGRLLEAETYIQKALTISGDKPDELEHLGDVEFKLGNKENAIKTWQKAFNMDKSNHELKSKIDKGEL